MRRLTTATTSRWALALAALAAGLTGTTLTSTAFGASPGSQPVRIMAVGDSITEGVALDGTYRPYLWRALGDRGHHVDFVGDRHGIRNGEDRRYRFDADHQSWSGWRADQVGDTLAAAAARHRPDIVLIHLGTNDINQRRSIGRAASAIEGAIRAAQVGSPDATILVAQLIGRAGYQRQTAALNRAIARVVATSSTPRSLVVLVDHHDRFEPKRHTRDGTHPNAAGSRLMAQRWLAAVEDALDHPARRIPAVARR
ncbi:MAG TPA: SGNH/GDSL hydrolase family protein [Acidimicrobiales bacterium]|nr:SGNH/GDSL hydrolase family protein [Acidimicrobiales bacterium]